MGSTLRALAARLTLTLTQRAERLRAEPDRGSHSVEYAIGIGLGAAIILALYASYRSGVATVVSGWVFQ
ncbi:hypothetical protein [Micromonospora sp. NBC_01813]|uniref:hypothetical protein n=1 Tax=Micromonospora sp. NBC_01813 TaxID=2975988 RepID=UPI002DDB412C|nr:hypothetical protein [Micromonospora sp. NBC_01813]WSA06964.1 hypothetical protein OG958_22220 [Micromonospora sp. NBC_01813]